MTPGAFLLRVAVSLVLFAGFIVALALFQHWVERPR